MSAEDKSKEVRGPLCFICNKFTVGGLEAHKEPRKVLHKLYIYFSLYPMKGDGDDFRPYSIGKRGLR